jgi:hypothetical protein
MMAGAQIDGKKGQWQARGVAILCCIVAAALGFSRIEDRAVFGVPGAAAIAQAAIATEEAPADPEFYESDDPDRVVPVARASTVPRNRVRRALRARDIPALAANPAAPVIPAPPVDVGGGVVPDPGAPSFVSSAGLPVLGGAAPALAPIGNQLFTGTSPGGGGTSGGGTSGGGDGASSGGGTGGTSGGGGTSTGGTGGGGVVTAVPEPSTWLMMILGFLMFGSQIRRRRPAKALPKLSPSH